MQDLTAKRTLVKSPPELWEELSEVERLAKHLGAFGEIRITKLEPEHTVAWEGEHASGTVSIEPSGWGTKVILTAELAADRDPPNPGADGAGEPVGAAEEATVEVAEADATTEEDEPAHEEPANDEPAHGEPAHAEPAHAAHKHDVHQPVAEIPPVAASNFEPAPAQATGTGVGPGSAPCPNPPRRRRGFWARLFAGWLVPEERLNRAAVEPRDEAVEERAVAVPEAAAGNRLDEETEPEDQAPAAAELEEKSTEYQPPAESGAVAVKPATETPADHVEPADPPAEEESHRLPKEPVAEGPAAIDLEGARSVLEETLNALGSAHHRPYSRS